MREERIDQEFQMNPMSVAVRGLRRRFFSGKAGPLSLALCFSISISGCGAPQCGEDEAEAAGRAVHAQTVDEVRGSIPTEGTVYLALGDSISFGYTPLANPDNATQFVGFPALTAWQRRADLQNLSCPGETAASMLGTGALDDGCRSYRALHPLHTNYEADQLHAAVDLLSRRPQIKRVLVSLGLGDLMLIERGCAFAPDCILAQQETLKNELAGNLRALYAALRKVYHGPIVFITLYAVDFGSSLQQQVLTGLAETEKIVADEFNVEMADGYGAMKAAAGPSGDTCAAGLLVQLADETCDLHPSLRGQLVLTTAALNPA